MPAIGRRSEELLRALWKAYTVDQAQVRADTDVDNRRQAVLPSLLMDIQRFASGSSTLAEFHEALSNYTAENLGWIWWWRARILLRLLIEAGGENLAGDMRRCFGHPESVDDAIDRSTIMLRSVRALAEEQSARRGGDGGLDEVTPMGVLLVLSGAWEVFDRDRYPVASLDTWDALAAMELLAPADQAAPDYGAFVDAAAQARRLLGIGGWALEHAASWHRSHPFIGFVASDFDGAQRNGLSLKRLVTVEEGADAIPAEEAARNVRALHARLRALAPEPLPHIFDFALGTPWSLSSERMTWSKSSPFRPDAWLSAYPDELSVEKGTPELRIWVDEGGVYTGIYLEGRNPGLLSRQLGHPDLGTKELHRDDYQRYSSDPPLRLWHEGADRTVLIARHWSPSDAVANGARLAEAVQEGLGRCSELLRVWLRAQEHTRKQPQALPRDEPLRFDEDQLELYIKLSDQDRDYAVAEILTALTEHADAHGQVLFPTNIQLSEEMVGQLREALSRGYRPKLLLGHRAALAAVAPLLEVESSRDPTPAPADPLRPRFVAPGEGWRTWLRIGRLREPGDHDPPLTAEAFALANEPHRRLSEIIAGRAPLAYVRYQPLTEDVLDPPLRLPSPKRFEDGLGQIGERLLVSREDVVEAVVANLVAGHHVILVGPTGTGKTELARLIPEVIFDVEPYLVTATADWTSYDVIGGPFPTLHPTPDGGYVQRYGIRRGHVYEAVLRNWETNAQDRLRREKGKPVRRRRSLDGRPVEGTWLIIDELNRADADKAFGDLITALDHMELRVPYIDPERPGTTTEMLPIPRSFRIIGTMNSFDRHHLFQLSEALKRRFAFITVDVPNDPEAELLKVSDRVAESMQERGLRTAPESLRAAAQRLYEFLRFVRLFRPVGVAQAVATLEYAAVRAAMTGTAVEGFLDAALAADLVPQLETLSGDQLLYVRHWAEGRPDRMAQAFEASLPQAAEVRQNPASLRDLHEVAGYLADRCEGEAAERAKAIAELLAEPLTEGIEDRLRMLLSGTDEEEELPPWSAPLGDGRLGLQPLPRVARELATMIDAGY